MKIPVKYSRAQNDIFFPTQKEGFPKFTHVRKGRRLGLTQGAAQAFIEYGLSGPFDFWFLPKEGPVYIMWGDTVNGNIKKYIDRYFMPILRKLPPMYVNYDRTNKTLHIGRAIIDFRSADKPENWEGFGYHIIFLNEAGIILEDDYLYENAVLPMLMDYQESRLIAAGVPKGKRHKYGLHKFYDMFQKGKKDPQNYRLLCYNSYQNAFIGKEQIDLIASIMDPMAKRQEIDGEFIDMTDKPYLYIFREEKHVIAKDEFSPSIHQPILLSFDFNVEPATCIVSQKPTFDSIRIFDELEISNGSTPEICEELLVRYPEFKFKMEVTGDASGHSRTSLIKGNINHYTVIQDMLEIMDGQMLVPDVNPSHTNSRLFCNSILNKLDVKITENCARLISDCIFTRVDDRGQLIKTADEGRHLFDNFRYTLHAAFPDFLENPNLYING